MKNKAKTTTTQKSIENAQLFDKVQKLLQNDEVDGWILIKQTKEMRIFEKEGKYRIGVTPGGSLVPMMHFSSNREETDESSGHN